MNPHDSSMKENADRVPWGEPRLASPTGEAMSEQVNRVDSEEWQECKREKTEISPERHQAEARGRLGTWMKDEDIPFTDIPDKLHNTLGTNGQGIGVSVSFQHEEGHVVEDLLIFDELSIKKDKIISMMATPRANIEDYDVITEEGHVMTGEEELIIRNQGKTPTPMVRQCA